jgi:hypothetical protein
MYYEQVKYIVYDIESVPDGQLIADVRYPDETLSPEEAIARYKQEISNNTDGRTDFIPATFQYPVSLAMALVDDSFLPVDIVVLDYPMGRALEITREFWQKVEHECNQPVLVTFNGRGFDVPLMELMAYKFGLPLKKHFNNKSGPATDSAISISTCRIFFRITVPCGLPVDLICWPVLPDFREKPMCAVLMCMICTQKDKLNRYMPIVSRMCWIHMGFCAQQGACR